VAESPARQYVRDRMAGPVTVRSKGIPTGPARNAVPAGATQGGTVWADGSYAGPVERRRNPLLKLALVVGPALLLIAGVAGYAGLRAGEKDSVSPSSTATRIKTSAETTSDASKSPAVSASPSGSTSKDDKPSPKPSPSTSQPADVPAGWHRYKDKTGFSIALPKGWHVTWRNRTRMRFRGPGSSGNLMIDQTTTPKSNAVKDWKEQEPYQRPGFPGYKRVKIKAVDYFKTAADWEFTYGYGSNRQHVVNRGFVTSKHHGYAIYWETSDRRWDKEYHFFKTFTATFKPAK
jgi:hypothetical protein